MSYFHRFNLVCGLAMLGVIGGGCAREQKASNAEPTPQVVSQSANAAPGESTAVPAAAMVHFSEVTAPSGIRARHFNGAFGAALLPEAMGSGCAVFDYNGDGWPDIYLSNGRAWTPTEIAAYHNAPLGQTEAQQMQRQGHPASKAQRAQLPLQDVPRSLGTLYRNNGDGTFSDVTHNSGLEIPMQGMGVAAADYDGDGRTDLCLTSYGRLFLFHNETGKNGAPHFSEVAARAGTTGDGWSTSAAFVDYDRDGRVDLFVCRYLKYAPGIDVFRSIDRVNKSYGWPSDYPSQTCLLFHNRGNGRFENVSQKAGISRRLSNGKPIEGAALGVTVADANGDGWPDLLVANDQRPNFYFVNQKNGTFVEQAAKSGIALSMAGKARGGMGIDSADINHSGHFSVAVGHFNAEGLGLWQNSDGAFQDISPDIGMSASSITSLTFGLLFADLNNDSWPDLLAANGHIDPKVHRFLMLVHYHEPPLLYLNETTKPGQPPRFAEVGARAGLTQKMVARGLAVADFDLDGDLDLLFTTNDEAPHLYRNDGTPNHALRVQLRGAAPNTDAIGARLEAHCGAQITLAQVRSGSSYLSQSELPATLGLGAHTRVDRLIVRWPDGKSATFSNLDAGQIVTIEEGKGVVSRRAFVKPKSAP